MKFRWPSDETRNRVELALTIVITLLILLELVIALSAISEGKTQLGALNAVKDSLEEQSATLTRLADQQRETLTSIQKGNEQLQESVKNTKEANSAMHEQLRVLRTDQHQREIEAGRKPILRLRTNEGHLLQSANAECKWTRIGTDDHTAFCDLSLENIGNAQANNTVLEVNTNFDAYVKIESPPAETPSNPQIEVFQGDVTFPYLRPGRPKPVRILVRFGDSASKLWFGYQANEVVQFTPLGVLILDPKQIP